MEYLVKPFRLAELRARVNAHLRRQNRAPQHRLVRGGVCFDLAAKSAAGGLVELLKREQSGRGVKVHTEENEITIDIFVIVEFGTRISVVANNIIEKVKYNIEHLTGMNVKKVNINVQGVRVQK